MFKAAALLPDLAPQFTASPAAPPRAFVADRRFRPDDGSAQRLRDELARSSPVGAAIEEELRQQRGAQPIAPAADETVVRAEAFAAGRAQAAREHEAELAAARQMIAALRDGFGRQLEIDAEALAPPLETLILAIARAVVDDELAAAPHSVRARVAGSLAALGEGAAAELRVHPADVELFPAAPESRLVVVADSDVARGDFRLRRGDAELVDRIADRFGRIERAHAR